MTEEILVLYVKERITPEQREEVRARLQPEFPGMHIAVVDGGATVQMIHPVSFSADSEKLERIAKATEKFAKQFESVSSGGAYMAVENYHE